MLSMKSTCCLVMAMFLSTPLASKEGAYRNIQINDVCIMHVKDAILYQNGVDFILVDMLLGEKYYRVYLGNHPRLDDKIHYTDADEFIFISNNDVYVKLKNRFPDFPLFMHIINFNDLSLIEEISKIEVKNQCHDK